MAHQYNDQVLAWFEEFSSSLADLGDVLLLFNGSEKRFDGARWQGRVAQYSDRELAAMGYKTMRGKLFPGHAYFLLMRFFQQRPD